MGKCLDSKGREVTELKFTIRFFSRQGGDEIIESGVLVWKGAGGIWGRTGVEWGHICICNGLGWGEGSKGRWDMQRESRENIKEVGSVIGFWEDGILSKTPDVRTYVVCVRGWSGMHSYIKIFS